MAKVMVSLPDDLLRVVDAEASRCGTTRSGLLRDLAEDTLQRRTAQRAERIAADHGIAVDDASYVAAAESWSARLVSRHIRDLAFLPADIRTTTRTDRP